MALSVINRLTWRGSPGDQVLAEDLLACLRGEPLAGMAVPVEPPPGLSGGDRPGQDSGHLRINFDRDAWT